MLNKQQNEGRYQVAAFSLDELVSKDHLVPRVNSGGAAETVMPK